MAWTHFVLSFQKRLPVPRCAELIVKAGAYELGEAWFCYQVHRFIGFLTSSNYCKFSAVVSLFLSNLKEAISKATTWCPWVRCDLCAKPKWQSGKLSLLSCVIALTSYRYSIINLYWALMLNFWLSWMLQPILTFMYVMQYCPFIGFFVINKVTPLLSCNIIWNIPPAYYVECIPLELEVPSWMTSCGDKNFKSKIAIRYGCLCHISLVLLSFLWSDTNETDVQMGPKRLKSYKEGGSGYNLSALLKKSSWGELTWPFVGGV